MVFVKEYILKSDYSDNNGFADNASILEVLTSVSKAHTDFLKVSLPENIVWMVLDWKLRVERRPLIGEKLFVKTWVCEQTRAFSLRCYELVNDKGEKCAEASSRWALVNADTRKLFRISSDITDHYEIDKGINPIEESSFIKNISKDAVFIKSIDAEISRSMIDDNNHVHNTVYCSLAESVLPSGINIDSVDISYRKEICPDEKISLEYCLFENQSMVLIKNTENHDLNAIVLFA